MTTDLAMDWRWVGAALTIPALVGMLVAYPAWRWGNNPTIGAILGALPIFIATVALIGREFIEIQRFYRQCHALLVNTSSAAIFRRTISPDSQSTVSSEWFKYSCFSI